MNFYRRFKFVFLLLSVTFTHSIFAQSYGNEWIDTSKVHVKIGVGRDGVYKINFLSIESIFADRLQFLSTISLSQFRMYNMGKEVPIFINDQNKNGSFDVFDHIEFVGHKPDGAFDNEIYVNPGDQRHTLQSMVSDSNYYFLTWRSVGQGLRYQNYTGSSSASSKAFHMAKVVDFQSLQYHEGIPLILGNQPIYLCEYSNAEGFVGSSIVASGYDTTAHTYQVKLKTPFPYSSGGIGKLELGLAGSSVLYSNPAANNHKVIIRVSPDGNSWRRLGDTIWANRRAVNLRRNLAATDFGSETYVSINSSYVSNIPFSNIYYSHAILEYPRLYNLGDSARYFYTEDSAVTSQKIEWDNYGAGMQKNPVIYDEVNLYRIEAAYDANSRKVSYVIPPTTKLGRVAVYDKQNLIELYNTDCKGVWMKDFSGLLDLKGSYLMITSQDMMNSPKEEIFNYANTWASRYNVNVTVFEDLCNSFSYGLKHPLAVRHFAKYILEHSPNYKPQYLLLIGRGYDMRYNRGSDFQFLKGYQVYNHIPGLGTPVSDIFYTSGLNGTQTEPAIPTGRIPANTPADVGRYLEKLRSYLNTYDDYAPWHKNVLHLSGGGTVNQAISIRSKLDIIAEYPKGNPLAGTVTTYAKTAGSVVDENFRAVIQNKINEGVNLVTFLGHGSPSVTDIDIGDPNEYFNEGRYPICYFNGCYVGNVSMPGLSQKAGIGEKMFSADRKGAVAFIGQTTTSELYKVAEQMDHFYYNYFDSVEDKTIGNVLKKTVSNYQIPSSIIYRLHCQNLFLSGDPALPIFNPALPDYSVSSSSLFIDPPNTIALQDSFRVGIVVSNYGKGIEDSITIRLDRTFPNISVKRSFILRRKMSGFRDTVYFIIKSKDISTAGDNTFAVTLNEERNPTEYTYDNNQASVKFYIPANGVNLIMPQRFAIVGSDSVDMVVQKADLFKESDDFYLELDTTPWFNSPVLISLEKNNTPLTAGVMAKWRIKLPILKDTQVYFWRARMSTSGNQGGSWSMRSFTYIKNHGEGWMQNLYWQYRPGISNNDISQLLIDSASRSLQYRKISKKIYIDCQFNESSRLGVKESGFGSQDLNFGAAPCIGSGLVAIPWDAKKVERTFVDPNIIEPQCEWGRKWTKFGHFEDYQIYYGFNMNDSSSRRQFVKFMDALEDSMYVTIYTVRSLSVDKWEPSVYQALNKVGSAVFDTVSNRTSNAVLALLGRKGWSKGTAYEDVSKGGYASVEADMVGIDKTGYMVSEIIGPVNQFNSMYFYPKYTNNKSLSEADKYRTDVYGVKPDGSRDVVLSDKLSSPQLLQSIDPNQYRFIQMNYWTEDPAGRTSPNLVNWRVSHDSVPEGSLFPDVKLGYLFHKDTLYEGDTLRMKIPFKNIGYVKFRDSILLNFTLTDKVNRVILDSGSRKYPALLKDGYFIFEYKRPTTGLQGSFGLQISVNPDFRQPEKTLVNNSYLLNFFITKDIVRPVLEVTFDGRHILNGDIVSANPVVVIQSKDENQFLWQKDTSTFDLYIKRPGSTNFDLVKMGTEALFFPATDRSNLARVEYRPADLASGLYTLRVQSRDAKQNNAGIQNYEIEFNVVREQSITHFYPYPNPFTSSMRFVFTLTGTQVPDDIRVKIMTTEGRVVREVSKAELGDIHVGNNITQWSWDGTDQYGDKLGNGTYFYKVTVKNAGEDVKLRATKGDDAFKDQVGVIYLLR